ncbi:cytochrome P450 [Sphingomonas sp. SRS2]|uniref:cytochrome P450 n=1 Tax=Sphingomonas sp. SRS2 TaxID=133190 RepID=UPI000618438B|nr:cytochrome P450 [Sphingomonas sp. SRS2]KKC24033.1 hypothetical protein WP12_21585 [Sphingomonas sp. SRS2]
MISDVASAEVPTLDVDPYAIETLLDPYPFHDLMRDAAPVVRFSRYGNYAVSRYDQVKAVLSNSEDFCSRYGAGLTDIRDPDSWRQPGPIVEADPPSHTQVRGVLNKIISPKIVRGWQVAFDAESVTVVDSICKAGVVNAAKDISEAYVLKVFPESLGIQPHRENMVIVGDYNFNALGPKNALFEESAKAMAGIADWLEAARSREGIQSGSFSDQVYKAEDAGALAEGVASGLLLSMYRGGTDTTISGISTALRLLAERPELWATLRKDRSRVKMVFEEAIRLETPIQSYFRTTTRDVEIDGLAIPKDSKVQVFPGAANRDPRKWADPDNFDIHRVMAGHIAFGFGIHQCIGQLIARMEAESILTAMLDRVERMELTGTPVYRPLNMLRTLDNLPIRVTPA